MNRTEIISFLTIKKEIYNFYLSRMSEKVHRFYTGALFPPTIGYNLDPKNCEVLQPIEKTLGLILKESNIDIKNQFKDNIEIQEKVLNMIKKRNEEFNYRCGLIKLTTGKGKSHVIMDITNYYQTNTLILCHNVKTIGEMFQKFIKNSNITPAIYGGGKKEIGNITIMTKKSFCLDFNKINNNFGLILIDEAPIGFSKIFWNALNRFCGNKKGIALYGLSGTPRKILFDTCDLEKYFGKIIQVKGQKNNGYNIIPKIKMYDYYFSGMYRYESPAEMRTAISENLERLDKQIIVIKELLEKSNCLLILTDRKNEIENLYNKLSENNNYNFLFCMTGDTKEKDDNENIKRAEILINQGQKVIILGTIQKVGVGVDIPFIDGIFLASAIKFESTVIQAIGRGLRKYKGKENVLVGIWNDLPILKNQKTEKIKAIESEYLINKLDIEIKTIGKINKIKI